MTTAITRSSAIAVLISFILISAYIVSAKDLPAGRQDSTSAATRKDKVSDRVETRRAQVQEKIETRKENISERLAEKREKTASREAALKTKLDGFRNRQKAQIVERVNSNLKSINEKMVAHFKKVLERLGGLLNKLEARVNVSPPDIKDPVLARQAIADARSSIASATEAVNLQSTKDYTLELSSESRAKTEVTAARKLLHEDLKVALRAVNDAKKSVSNAIRIAKSGSVPSGTGLKEATKSGQQQ